MTRKSKDKNRNREGASAPKPEVTGWARVLANSPMCDFKRRLGNRRELDQKLGRGRSDDGRAGQGAPASPGMPRSRRRAK